MTKKVIIPLFILMTIITSCLKINKIETDNLIGKWKLVEFTSNGVDSVQYYNDSCGDKMRVTKPYPDDCDYMYFYGKKDFFAKGYFVNGNRTLKVYCSTNNDGLQNWSFGPFGIGRKSEWKVLKLTSNDFKISTVYAGKNYNISFIKL